MKKKIVFIFGTRPEIIKMSPIIARALERQWNFFIIHTGQHYSESMDKVFWDNFSLVEPAYRLGVGSGTHAEQICKMMMGIEKILLEEKPAYVCVYGDPNSAIAGALVASKLNIPTIHLEGGLRSYDRTMPEEINRVVADVLSTYVFVPTDLQKEFLRKEGIVNNVFVVGNLIADVVPKMVPLALKTSNVHEHLELVQGEYFVTTLHRQAAVDDPIHFQNILSGLGLVAKEYSLPVVYAIHPRAKKNLETFHLTVPEGVRLVEPLDYFDFMALSVGAKLILSDSGGIQEEACMLHVPLVTLRENTERQETIELGSNILSGFEPRSILDKTNLMLQRSPDWKHPYGEETAIKIINILEEMCA